MKKSNVFLGFFKRWETALALITILVALIFYFIRPDIVTAGALLENTMVFMEKGFLVLSMMIIILMGDIDISVASTVALSSTLLAISYNSGCPFWLSVIIALATGLVCGMINGLVITKFKELAPMIVTLSTMTIYRGICYIILGDQASGKFPSAFSKLGWGYVGNTHIPINLVIFLGAALVFYYVLTYTVVGRRIYAIGSNTVCGRYSGINVDLIKFSAFTLNGLMASVTAIFLLSRLGSARPNIAVGYELDIIATVVLGGVSTAGGKGKVLGVVFGLFLIGFLRYGMGINNIPGQMMPMVVGILLILVIMVPNIVEKNRNQRIISAGLVGADLN